MLVLSHAMPEASPAETVPRAGRPLPYSASRQPLMLELGPKLPALPADLRALGIPDPPLVPQILVGQPGAAGER